MEIKKGTLVAIISGSWSSNYCIGLVINSENEETCKLKLRYCFATGCKNEDLVSIAENCTEDNFKQILSMEKMPEILQSFAKQCARIDAIESRINLVQKGLLATQERVRNHLDSQHSC